MKKIFGLFIIIAMVLSAGCSASYDSYGLTANSAPQYYNLMAVADSAVPGAIPPGEFGFYGGAEIMMTATGTGTAEASLPAERKIIRDADITLEVEDVDISYGNILRQLAAFGGYEADRNMHSNNFIRNGVRHSSPTVNATLKIPAANLDAFLEGLRDEGEIISSNISSADITEQYFDAQIKLTTLEKTLENYYRFLEEATDIDEQLRITRYINDITREIEQLKGSLRRWDSLVDYSTVRLNLYRPFEAPAPERVIEWDSLSLEDMGWFISSGFLGVVNAIFSVIQWAVIAAATASPVLVPAAVLIIVLIRRRRKNKNATVGRAALGAPTENNKEKEKEEKQDA
jgi:hypothetical protein